MLSDFSLPRSLAISLDHLSLAQVLWLPGEHELLLRADPGLVSETALTPLPASLTEHSPPLLSPPQLPSPLVYQQPQCSLLSTFHTHPRHSGSQADLRPWVRGEPSLRRRDPGGNTMFSQCVRGSGMLRTISPGAALDFCICHRPQKRTQLLLILSKPHHLSSAMA